MMANRTVFSVGDIHPVTFSLGGFSALFDMTAKRLHALDFSNRLWSKDPSIWSKGYSAQALISNSLGWLDIAVQMHEKTGEIVSFAETIKKEFEYIVLLGMGGSSLAPEVMRSIFGRQPGWPKLVILDTTDPCAIKKTQDSIEMDKTLFIVSSKSGTTIEVMSLFEFFHDALSRARPNPAGSNFIAITDPDTPLEAIAKGKGFRQVFINPPDIGGRFSALSYFGLIPAAVMGLDINRLLGYALSMAHETRADVHPKDDPAQSLGVVIAALAGKGMDKLTFLFSEELEAFGLWLEQLIAESLGKDSKGVIPVAGEVPGEILAGFEDRVFVHIGRGLVDEDFADLVYILERTARPIIS
ncbi:MAG: transaldolase, partial [Deltaproteobacteria bacterium]|nr:transaldolase [Deltaproteobacteria bacterium]